MGDVSPQQRRLQIEGIVRLDLVIQRFGRTVLVLWFLIRQMEICFLPRVRNLSVELSALLEKIAGKKIVLRLQVSGMGVLQRAGGGYFSKGAESKEAAEMLAMSACREKHRDCELMYSGCSLPVRVK